MILRGQFRVRLNRLFGEINHPMLQPYTKDPAKTGYAKQHQGPPKPSRQNRKSGYGCHPQSSDDLSKRGQYGEVRLNLDNMRPDLCNYFYFFGAKYSCAQQGCKNTSTK